MLGSHTGICSLIVFLHEIVQRMELEISLGFHLRLFQSTFGSSRSTGTSDQAHVATF